MSSPELHALVGPYVVDALDEAEREEFEAHLERCPTCQAEVAELVDVTAHLAGAAAVAVPDTLRSRVLEEVAATRQLPPRVGATPPRRLRRRGASLVAAAAVLVVGVVGVAGWLQAERRADDAEELLAIAAAPDARSVVLDSEVGQIRLVTSEARGQTMLVGQAVEAVPDDRTYELWFIGPDGPEPAGLFRPADDGTVELVTEGSHDGALGVTVEPEGGSPQPTGAIVASGTV